ncbi:class I adenylate-forming enzyme family protein [Caballeronia sp. DA-9]|uniref:class I adenylate-forming enzyme family protein n=1 Tax=Caballeronia sp. DA-9 TaxID=3436237 RepID=UPI003F665FE4
MPYRLITDEIPPPTETPLNALYRHASARPDAIALIAGDDVWTYERLATDVARLSNGLRRAGILPGDRITMIVRTSPMYAVFLFAAMMTGAIVAPLKTEFTAAELTELLRVQRPAVFIHEADLQEVVSQIDPAVLGHTKTFVADDHGARSWRHLMDDASREDAVLPADIDAPCLLLATSGTTGRPKLVAYNQRVISHVAGAAKSWALTHDACVIGSTPVAHVSGTFVMLVAMISGCREVLLSRFDADAVLDLIEEHGGTAIFLAPFLCMPLVEAQRKRARDVRSLEVCGVGGDACRAHIAEAFESTFDIQLENTYGLTECVGSTAFGYNRRTIRGVPGRTQLVDRNGVQVGLGEVGELHLRGPNLSLGYWTGPGDIMSHTRDGWFPTGDLMVEDADCDYRFVGRCKDLIVSDTNKISPVEVENVLIQHEAVADAAVAGAPDETSGQRVVALVKLTDKSAPAAAVADEILLWMKSRLAAFKLPEQVVIVDAIPRNALGKIDRNEVARIATLV